MLRIGVGAAVLLISLMSMTGMVHAQEDERPTAAERAALLKCLKDKRQAQQPEDGCIFSNVDVCMEKPSGHTTLGQRLCNARESAIWDELLNDRYKRLRAAVSKPGAKKLRNIQRSWISWRKAKCEMPYILFEGGTLAGPLAAGCVLKATAVRAIELGTALSSVGEKP